MRPHFACRDAVRVFYFKNQHVILVAGTKQHSAAIQLVRVAKQRMPTFCLRPAYQKLPKAGGVEERYYIVQPLFSGRFRPQVALLHRSGKDVIGVERLSAAASPAPEVTATATGFSQNFSFDEAFRDALKSLPMLAPEPTIVNVVSAGAIYGGFHGVSRMFVRVGHTSAAPAG